MTASLTSPSDHTSPTARCPGGLALLNVHFAVKTGGPWRLETEGFILDLHCICFPLSSSFCPVSTLKLRVPSLSTWSPDPLRSVSLLVAQSLLEHKKAASTHSPGVPIFIAR